MYQNYLSLFIYSYVLCLLSLDKIKKNILLKIVIKKRLITWRINLIYGKIRITWKWRKWKKLRIIKIKNLVIIRFIFFYLFVFFVYS